jgi:DNA-binding LytR/AlgR family response regulator
MTAIMMLVNWPGKVTHAPPAGAPAPTIRFIERLPAKLKGAVIYAISSEDHYLRLHTSKGSDLILMRLSDAISELEGLEGAQTHRSWWVTRDAVESSRRDGDKLVLTLKGGAEAPVSRPNIRPLREAGWF